MDKGVFFWSTLDLIVEYQDYISLGSRMEYAGRRAMGVYYSELCMTK